MNAMPVARLSVRQRLPRAALMATAIVSLVVAGWAGLARIGWTLPETAAHVLLAHGPLMVCGVLATVVGLERAVALQRAWPYAAPALSAAGALSLMLGLPIGLSAVLLTAGAAALVAVYVLIVRLQPAAYTRTMALGAALLLGGSAFWLLGQPLFRIVPWWMGFLVFTIAGERLELGRLQRLPARVQRAFAIVAVALAAAIAISALWPEVGVRATGVGLAALGAWLLRYDIARRTIRMRGLPRYVAVCLLGGHVWLVAGGVALALAGPVSSGMLYDAVLHMIFVGFVFSMIFGHAPIIVPAVLGFAIAPLRQFYLPLALLHASLILRVAGDVLGAFALRRWGGLLNAVALLAFAGMMVYAARVATRSN